MLTAVFLIGVLVSIGVGGTKTANADRAVSTTSPFLLKLPKPKKEPTCNKWKIVQGIRHYRAAAWTFNWQEGRSYARFSKWKPEHSCGFLKYLAAQSRRKSRQARQSFNRWFSVIYAKWECIHSHEGAWNSATGNGFYGGLQMDLSFQRSHGSSYFRIWGTADRWPVWSQLRAAENAYRTRGFSPWPNTARACGLI